MARATARLTGAAQTLIRAHLEWIYRLTWRRPLLVLAVSLLLVALSAFSIRGIAFESDIFKLFPTQQGPLRLFLDTIEWTGSANEAYFLLEGEKGRLVPEAEAFAGRLRALRVDGAPGFRKVSYRTFDPAEMPAFADFVGYAVSRPQLFIDPADAGRFAERLTPEQMAVSLRRATTELASQVGMGMRDLIAADPLYLRELILPRLQQGSRSLDLDPASPYFISRDGQVLIVIAEPARPVQDMAFARKLVAGINEARAGAKVTISCAGAHLSAVIDEAVMKRNIIACIISSLVVVLGLFYLTYRRIMPTLLIPLIILFGVVLALGTAGLFLPSVHIISFAFTALIIGLGTDYSIHLYDRFHAERSRGKETAEALHLAVVDTGHGLFTAGTTTALPFLALTISDVRALSELGLLVGLGVLFSLYATLFFLPPLLLFVEQRFPATYAPLPGFGLGALWDAIGRHRRPVAALSLLLVLGLGIASFSVSFEGELKNLQPRHSEAFLTQEKIERHLSLAPKQLIVAVEGPALAQVLESGHQVGLLAEQYRQRGELASWSALGQLVNGPEGQEKALEALGKQLSGKSPGMDFRALLAREGFAPEPFEPFAEGLGRLTAAKPAPVAEAVERLAASPLRGMVEHHLIRRGDGYHLLLYLNYAGPEFHQQRFLRELTTVSPTARATSVDLVSSQLADSVKKSFLWGFALGGALVLFLLASHFSSLAGIIATLFPVLSGVIAMLGIMAIGDLRLNFMNSMVLVTILGMGSDYGLHLRHRVEQAADNDGARREFIQAGRAVLLSALTTIAGFGSLAFTDYGAMASIGSATNWGIGATLFFALVTLPSFAILRGKRG